MLGMPNSHQISSFFINSRLGPLLNGNLLGGLYLWDSLTMDKTNNADKVYNYTKWEGTLETFVKSFNHSTTSFSSSKKDLSNADNLKEYKATKSEFHLYY
mmetsp:Transcript_33266/g.51021  ORF Transcript_33266/g.51021 Transcript_33266/m.51021 type:complete len:100 (+) Transcript_33266:908-1207(+)